MRDAHAALSFAAVKVGRLSVVIAACAALGCGAGRSRVAYRIDSVSGLVISSAPAVHEAPEPSVRGEQLVFAYPLFAENHAAAPAELDLVGARAAIVPEGDGEALEPFRATCLEHDPARRTASVAVLARGARVRIDCTIEIPRAQMAKVHNADREIALTVPVRAGEQQETVLFTYLLFAGDVR